MNRRTITKESEWLTGNPSREKLWNDYENFPSWLKEKIEEDINKCKQGNHSWKWEPSEEIRDYFKCSSKGCNAESKIGLKVR